MLGLILLGWFNHSENWKKATLITGKMSGKKSLFNVADCGSLVLLCSFHSHSCTALYKLYTAVHTNEQLGSLDHWAKSLVGDVFVLKEQKITWLGLPACGLQHHWLENILLIWKLSKLEQATKKRQNTGYWDALLYHLFDCNCILASHGSHLVCTLCCSSVLPCGSCFACGIEESGFH